MRRGRTAGAGAGGAYLLLIVLDRPLRPGIATLPDAVLPRGLYVYCGSAYGPGGLDARIARHLRTDKASRWHVDRLTAAGRVVAVHAAAGKRECDLVTRILRAPDTWVPVAGFGSSDCRHCLAHLISVPAAFDPACIAPRFEPGV